MGKNDRTQNYRNDYNWDDELDDDSPLDDDDLGGHYTGNRNYGSGRSGGGNTNTLLVIICVLLAVILIVAAIIIGVRVLPGLLDHGEEPNPGDTGYSSSSSTGGAPQLPSALPTMFPSQGTSQQTNPGAGGYPGSTGNTGYTGGTGSTAPTSTSSAPSAADVSQFGNEIAYPNKNSYLPGYETMYVKSGKGHSIYVYVSSTGGEANRRKNYYCYEGDAVTVLARENGMSCVIFVAGNGETHIGWVSSKYLVY